MFFFFLLPSELQLNCWISQKFWLWLAALYHMMETISLVSPHFTVFLRAAWNGTFHLPGFVNAQMCWGLSRSNAPRQRKKKKMKRKVSCLWKVDDMFGSLVWENGSYEFEAVRLFFDSESKLSERPGLISWESGSHPVTSTLTGVISCLAAVR